MRTGIRAMLLVAAALAAVLPTGCMNAYKQRVNQALWERDMRAQEDCIWRLKWALEDKQRELDDANQRAGTARKEADVFRGDNRAASGPELSAPPAFNPLRNNGGDAPTLPAAPVPLDVQPGREFTPSSPGAPPRGPNSSVFPSPAEQMGPALSQAGYTEPDVGRVPLEKLNPDVNVERISLNPGLTGPIDPRGASQDELLSVTIEQRDARDQRVLAPGDVSIVVMDPVIEGRAARIARWDFDAEEVAKHVRRNRDGGSLQFELPWPKQPVHSDLRLYVRFTTYDGRRLEDNLPIDVKLAGGKTNGWTKAKTTADAGNDVANKPGGWADALPPKRSFYDRTSEDSDSGADQPAAREAARSRPAWSPYR